MGMGIFVITPMADEVEEITEEVLKSMHLHMRLHSAMFLQFVPVLCIAMTANFVEGYFDNVPRSMPSRLGWAALGFYIVATTLETMFATYAIFFYEGNYQIGGFNGEGRAAHYKVNPWLMQAI